jgi:hypothetical protein
MCAERSVCGSARLTRFGSCVGVVPLWCCFEHRGWCILESVEGGESVGCEGVEEI